MYEVLLFDKSKTIKTGVEKGRQHLLLGLHRSTSIGRDTIVCFGEEEDIVHGFAQPKRSTMSHHVLNPSQILCMYGDARAG